MSQPAPVKLAHHCHALAKLIAAARWARPALLIVRDSVGAIGSFVQRKPSISLRQALRNWIRFHRALLPYRNGFVTATFEQVTGDFGQVIERVNTRFDTGFHLFPHTEGAVAARFRRIAARHAKRFGREAVVETGVARPRAGSAAHKELLKEQLVGRRRLAQPLWEVTGLYEEHTMLAVFAPRTNENLGQCSDPW